MKKIKKIFKVLGLTLLILIALSGIGITGAFYSNKRGRYLNKQITIEMLDKKNRNEARVNDQIQEKG